MKKAFVLSAGLGTRLQPLTDTIPKPLIAIDGKPLMDHWLKLFLSHGINSLCINSHHLHDAMIRYVETISPEFEVQLVYEEKLLGSAGTLLRNKEFVKGEDEFLVVYADNLTNANLTALAKKHREGEYVATLGLFRTEFPQACGIAEVDENGMVIHFIEKPKEPKSNLAFCGLMVASPKLFEWIPEKIPCDLGKDILPKLSGKMGSYELKEYLRDIGDAMSYEKAQKEWAELQRGTK
ncbi:MAG: nucleotidyl transferase [Nitrospinae bacterium CG11_big_fil_rev_8_21_14_0_20_45_15]|nr:MAG: nucleotidyl transferase [Nitrospinae bacterium CG11_big_fil_rev_8_21_14_0_20_45_15]